ncbi:Uncharacterized protein T06_8397 [Trichinella sp. T6]|nr:Uncharacterized protein T06_8397 [Trichinella sp. T6]
MDEWLIRKPVKREIAEMESQKGSTAGDVNNKRKIDENESANFQLSNRRKVIRKYDIDYLKFEFTWNSDHKDPRPFCVICYEILADVSMRPNKLLRHIETKHMDLNSKPLQFSESKLFVYMPLFPYGNPKFGALLKMEAADIFSVHDKIRDGNYCCFETLATFIVEKEATLDEDSMIVAHLDSLKENTVLNDRQVITER